MKGLREFKFEEAGTERKTFSLVEAWIKECHKAAREKEERNSYTQCQSVKICTGKMYYSSDKE